MNPDDPWSSQDINQMSMAEYAKYREYLMEQVGLMTADEAREAVSIPKPPPPTERFTFTSF